MLGNKLKYIQYIRQVSLVVVLTVFFVVISASYAQPSNKNPESLQIDGLTFLCKGCVVYRENFCKLSISGENLALPCSPDARGVLLQQTAQGSYDGAAPSKDELLRFLLKRPAQRNDVKNALKLLLSNADGEAVLKKETWFLLSHHVDLLNELLHEGIGDDDFWLIVATMPTKDSSEEQLKLRLLVMDKVAQVRLQPLQMSLAFDLDMDSSFLNRAYRIATQHNLKSAQGLKYALDYIEKCSGAYAELTKAIACEQQLIGADLWQEYLAKGNMRQAIRAFRQKEITAAEWIKYVAEVVPEQRLTAEVINLTGVAFRSELKGQTVERAFPSDKVNHLFALLQEKDRSFGDFVRGKKKSGVSITALLIVIVPLLVLFIGSGFALAVWLKRRREVNSFNNDPFVADYGELKELLNFFSIDINATSEELSKSFRTLAKEVHPDKDPRNGEKFAELKKKHDRARELLDKFHSA